MWQGILRPYKCLASLQTPFNFSFIEESPLNYVFGGRGGDYKSH